MNILLTKPYKQNGGVFSFCESIVPALNQYKVCVVKRGIKENRRNIVGAFIDQTFDYISFIHKLLMNKYDIVFVNSSLSKSACIRDGIYILLSKVLKNKVLLFIHVFIKTMHVLTFY